MTPRHRRGYFAQAFGSAATGPEAGPERTTPPSHGVITRNARRSSERPSLPATCHRGLAGSWSTSCTRTIFTAFAKVVRAASDSNGNALSLIGTAEIVAPSTRGVVATT